MGLSLLKLGAPSAELLDLPIHTHEPVLQLLQGVLQPQVTPPVGVNEPGASGAGDNEEVTGLPPGSLFENVPVPFLAGNRRRATTAQGFG